MIQTVTSVIVACSALLLAAAASIAVVKIVRGPSALDRVVASDLMVAVVIAAVGLRIVSTGHQELVLVLLILSLVGFTGATSVARLVGDRVRLRRRAEGDRS